MEGFELKRKKLGKIGTEVRKMRLDLSVPIKAMQRFLSKYRKMFIIFIGFMIVFAAFVMGYRLGSFGSMQSIFLSAFERMEAGLTGNAALTQQSETLENANDEPGTDRDLSSEGLGALDVSGARESDPAYIIAELEASGFDEKLMTPSQNTISLSYGWQRDPVTEDWRHSSGVRFATNGDTHVYAAMSGVVVSVDQSGIGYEVVILHPFDMSTRYSNLDSVTVTEGSKVMQGDVLGHVNSGAESRGLYFEVRRFGETLDPMSLFAGTK